jgi:hypothetical protein
MSLRRLLLIVMVVAAVVVAGIYFFPTDKSAAVTRLLDAGMAAVEREDLDKLDKLISLYYKDDLGFTYTSMRGNFSYVFREFDHIKISLTTDEIVIGKDTCTARVSLWVRGNWFDKQSDMVGTENGYEPVVFYCVREFFRWKIIGTHWPDRKPGIPEL